MAFKVVVVLFLSIEALFDFASCDCNPDVIRQCITDPQLDITVLFFTPVLPYYFDHNILVVPTNQTTFPTTCSKLSIAATCLKSNTTCDSADIRLLNRWNEVNNSISFLCNDGKAGFAQFQTCTTKSSYVENVTTCMANVSTISSSTGLFVTGPIINDIAYCKYLSSQFACYVNAAQSNCNSGDFVTNYYKKYEQSEADSLLCTLEPKDQASVNRCNYIKLDQCSSILLTQLFFGDNKYDPTDLFIKPFNATQISEICNALNNATKCIESVPGCDSSDANGNTNWNSANDAWSYICKDGQAGLTQFQTCVQNTSTYANLSACMNQSSWESVTPTVICQYFKTMLTCEAQTAKVGCDSEQFVAKVFVKAINPSVRNFHCVLSYNTNPPPPPPSTGTMSMITRSNGITLLTNVLFLYLLHNY